MKALLRHALLLMSVAMPALATGADIVGPTSAEPDLGGLIRLKAVASDANSLTWLFVSPKDYDFIRDGRTIGFAVPRKPQTMVVLLIDVASKDEVTTTLHEIKVGEISVEPSKPATDNAASAAPATVAPGPAVIPASSPAVSGRFRIYSEGGAKYVEDTTTGLPYLVDRATNSFRIGSKKYDLVRMGSNPPPL